MKTGTLTWLWQMEARVLFPFSWGNGLGAFGGQTTFATGGSGQPIGLIAADFNGDGHLDLAAVNLGDVAILLGTGTGAFTLHANPGGTGTGDLIAGVVGDYNGDGI